MTANGMPEDFGRHYRDVLFAPGRTAAALRLGWTLIDLAYAQSSTIVQAGYRYMERETHLQRRSLQRARDELVDAGALTVTSPTPGARGRTHWKLRIPHEAGAPERPPSANGADTGAGAPERPPDPRVGAPERPPEPGAPERTRPNPFLTDEPGAPERPPLGAGERTLGGGRWSGRWSGRSRAPTGPYSKNPASEPAPSSRARAREADSHRHVGGAGAGAGGLERIDNDLLDALPRRERQEA